ncbi:TetR/AcrR family transcriptional regulator [Caulobacter sp. AP07]|uniref:TetR/AcrR family transcriptional regulator n=1 Tax=Caulobacter sp. AP07 TaxID=1144304 RepID=UPI000316C8D5|nr:TetR family transcriptional regulator [Caulobacter sp. AP07]
MLDCAIDIAAEQGLANVTVSAVAVAAGVTKGGLFHHFASKQALVEAMVDDLLERLDQQIDQEMDDEPTAPGRFTRAYVSATLTMDERPRRAWTALGGSLAIDSSLTPRWTAWMDARLRRHADTDAAPLFEVIRLAVDGAWLAQISGAAHGIDAFRLRKTLLDLSRGVK